MKIEIESKGYFQTIKQFQFVKDIGVGSFGKVKLATHYGTKRQYAVKVIDLHNNLTPTEKLMLTREIKIHSKMNHPHIIKLWDTLIEDDKIFMIMDYAKNGSLFRYYSKLIEKNYKPSLSQIYLFFFQTLQAIKYMHSLDIMHRDVKPQNLLLDEDLNIKICDFGWATTQILMSRTTFCGTYQYMAPQMVLQKSYDYRIDIWALGILLFQLYHRKAPFQAENLMTIKQKINAGGYYVDEGCSAQLKDLIISILQFCPSNRLKIKQIQNHIWIKNCQKSKYEDQSTCQSQQIEKKRYNIYKGMEFQSNKFGQINGIPGIVKHQHQRSMDNLTMESYKITNFINSNQENSINTIQKNSKKEEQLKKHKRNITQPNDIKQGSYLKKINKEIPIDNNKNQREKNSPYVHFNMMVKQSNQPVKRSKIKCKTQAEQQLIGLQNYQRTLMSKKSLRQFQQFDQIKKTKKWNTQVQNINKSPSFNYLGYTQYPYNRKQKQNNFNMQKEFKGKQAERQKLNCKSRISSDKIAQISNLLTSKRIQMQKLSFLT